MTPSLPHDRPTLSSQEPLQDATTSWSVGWALTAITLTVLVVGVAVIRQLSAGPQSSDTTLRSDTGNSEAISSTADVEQETPPLRLVLRPEEPDSALVPHLQTEATATLDLPKAFDEGLTLPAYR